MHQLRREGHAWGAGQVPGAGEIAVAPAAVGVLQARLDRQGKLQLRPALGPGAANLERHVHLLATPFTAQVHRLRLRFLDVVAAGDLRRRHRAVIRAPAARRQAGRGGLRLAAVVGLARTQAVGGAGDNRAAGIELQRVEQAAAAPVTVAEIARDVPLGNLDGIGLRILRQVKAEVVRGQGQVVGGLELQGQLPALALALLALGVQADRRRHHETGGVIAVLVPETGPAPPVGVEVRRIAVDVDCRANFVAAVPLPALGTGIERTCGALLLRVANEDTEAVVLVVPGVRTGELAVGLLAGIGPGALGGDEAGMWLQFQRAPRLQDHRAADAAFVDARFRGLVQLRAAQQVRRQQRVVERARGVAVGFGGGDVVAVQFGQHQLRGQTAHADVLPLATVAADHHAGHALQRIGHVLVGELAHVLGGDDIDHGLGVALLLQTFFDRVAVAGHRHCVQVRGLHRGLARGRRRAVGLLGGNSGGGGAREQGDGDTGVQRAAVACEWRAVHFGRALPMVIGLGGFVSIQRPDNNAARSNAKTSGTVAAPGFPGLLPSSARMRLDRSNAVQT